MGPGLLGNMFDMNKDGKMDCFEQAVELSFLSSMEKESLKAQLQENGIDEDDFRNMSNEERREALEDAGVDSNEYEDYDTM